MPRNEPGEGPTTTSAWTKALAARVGASLALEGVIGYLTEIFDPGISLDHGASGGFGITPYESSLGIAGSIEFASLEAKPDYRRARILVNKATRVFPALRTQGGAERFGRRPVLPRHAAGD